MLPSIGNEVVKSVVAHYNAEQLLTQRDKVSRAVGDRAGHGLGGEVSRVVGDRAGFRWGGGCHAW